jgi:hypothetical protein
MEDAGFRLARVEGLRGQVYEMPDGTLVRVRTSQDRRFLATTDGAGPKAKHDFQKDNVQFVLLVIPQREGHEELCVAYFIPVAEALQAFQNSHADWLKSDPDTKGADYTWHLDFDDGKCYAASGFAIRWREFEL